MSFSSRTIRNVLSVLVLLGATGLAGCTSYTPVYGNGGANMAQASFQYAKPVNRLDQIIYQELTL